MSTLVRLAATSLALVSSLFLTSATLAAQDVDTSDSKIQKTLEKAIKMWLQNWKKGKVEITGADVMKGQLNRDKDFPSVKLGLQPEAVLKEHKGSVTPPGGGRQVPTDRYNQRDEITWLCMHMAMVDTVKAAEMLLRVAGAGLDGKKYKLEVGAETVRKAGFDAIATLKSDEAKNYVFGVASGDEKAKGPERAAALMSVGNIDAKRALEVFNKVVEDRDEDVRLAAMLGIIAASDQSSLVTVADNIRSEKNTNVLLKAMEALHKICTKAGKDVDQDGVRRAVTSVVERLGTTEDWRVELEAVRFLERARVKESVPALIELLAVFEEKPQLVESGKLTGTLKFETGRVLRELSGANYSNTAVQAWRDWWQGVKDQFKVTERRKPSESKTSSSFFGIPVRGSRILFIVDNSGSMAWQTVSKGKDGNRQTGIALAKRELLNAIEQLDAKDKFNVVRFSNGPEAWQRDLVLANAATKKSFTKFVNGLRADGATDLWGGLQTGLRLKSMAHGERFATEVDEVFILSDGAPSSGEIVDPRRIADVLSELNSFSKIRINTIFIQVEPPKNGRFGVPPFKMSGEELMKEIAAENDGKFLVIKG